MVGGGGDVLEGALPLLPVLVVAVEDIGIWGVFVIVLQNCQFINVFKQNTISVD